MRTIHHYKIAKTLATLLDTQFGIAGFRFGFDPLIGLIPWVGDIVMASLALYMVYIGTRLKMEQKHINKMILNIVIDFAIGIIPVIGIIGDIFFKAAYRNLKIIEKHGKIDAIDGEIVENNALSFPTTNEIY